MRNSIVAPLDKKFASVIKLLAKHTAKLAPGFDNDETMQDILNAQALSYPADAAGG